MSIADKIPDQFLRSLSRDLLMDPDACSSKMKKSKTNANIAHYFSFFFLLESDRIFSIKGDFDFIAYLFVCLFAFLPFLYMKMTFAYSFDDLRKKIAPESKAARELAAHVAGSSWAREWVSARKNVEMSHFDLIVVKTLFKAEIEQCSEKPNEAHMEPKLKIK